MNKYNDKYVNKILFPFPDWNTKVYSTHTCYIHAVVGKGIYKHTCKPCNAIRENNYCNTIPTPTKE